MGKAHPFVSSEARQTVTCLGFAALYFLFASPGLLLTFDQLNVSPLRSPMWPPAGLSVAAAMLLGHRIWPGIFLGALATTLSAGAPITVSVLVALGNTVAPVFAARMVVSVIGASYPLSHPQHVFRFFLGTGIIAALISACIGVASIGVAGMVPGGLADWTMFSGRLLTWWMGDMTGVVLVAPLILAWAYPGKDTLNKHQYAEVLALFVCAGLIIAYVFGGWSIPALMHFPVAFLLLPCLMWAAFRFGQRGATGIILLTGLAAIYGTTHGFGPFGEIVTGNSVLLAQGFVVIMAITTLTLAALVRERKLITAALRLTNEELELHVLDRTSALMTANHALEESEARWRSITESSPDNIMLLDKTGNILFINSAVPGLMPTQVVGSSIYDFVPKTEHQLMRDCFGKVVEAGNTGQFTVNFNSPDGELNYENRVGPVLKDNKVVALTVNIRDVTARTRAEIEIKKLNKRMRLLLESTSEGIFGVDPVLRCTFANRAAAQMLGYEVQEMIGQDMFELANALREDMSHRAREESLIYRTIAEDRSFLSDDEILWDRDGEHFPVQFVSNPITEAGEVIGAVVVFHNVAEARAMARKMDYLVAHDALTGLANRNEFKICLQQALDNAITKGSKHVLCYLDLDQFKIVNDTCGHIAGDEMLRQLTGLLQDKVRQNDTLARLGGDEFGILMSNCDTVHALKVVENIRDSLQQFRFVWEDKTFTVGASFGVTAITPATASVSDVLSEADSACYMAKDSGRGRVHVYQADDIDLLQRHGEMQWVSRIHEAFEQQRLSLVCQPIVPVSALSKKTKDSIVDDEGMFFEVLIRMMGENGQRIPPGAFIPAAERYNLMPTIDRWVVRSTLKWLHNNSTQMDHVTFCTINLSGHSLNDDYFLEFVIERLNESAINGDKICFEITETAAVANLTKAVHFIKRLKEFGCRFALDDFGSGMSSFSYLKNLPVDFLKIDGNFVRDIASDPIDYAMVEAVNRVGHVMGIKTIAEFVENDKVLEQLQKIGVDYVQGYGIAMPKALDEVFQSEY